MRQKKSGSTLATFGQHQLSQRLNTAIATPVTSPQDALNARIGSGLRGIEQASAPRVLPLELVEISVGIDNRPPYRARADIQADDIILRISQIHLDSPFLFRYIRFVALTQSDAASQNKGFASSAA